MTETYRLRGISDAVEIGTTLSRSWFRGHPRIHNNLTPKVFRPEWDDPWTARGGREVELGIIDDFKRRAPGLMESAPSPSDTLAWLFLMQHHGAPTRLLDWTESALVALYFAVEKHHDVDGELWAMFPDLLNERSDVGRGFPLLNNPVLQYLVEEPLVHDIEANARVRGLREVPRRPIALRPATTFPRMVAQLSVFTIHPKPQAGHTVPDILPEADLLVRYIVPAGGKRQLMNDLQALGVSRRTLFPDLDALSKTIEREHMTTIAYTPPRPPPCGGPPDT